jgi:hypothetical protein
VVEIGTAEGQADTVNCTVLFRGSDTRPANCPSTVNFSNLALRDDLPAGEHLEFPLACDLPDLWVVVVS